MTLPSVQHDATRVAVRQTPLTDAVCENNGDPRYSSIVLKR